MLTHATREEMLVASMSNNMSGRLGVQSRCGILHVFQSRMRCLLRKIYSHDGFWKAYFKSSSLWGGSLTSIGDVVLTVQSLFQPTAQSKRFVSYLRSS